MKKIFRVIAFLGWAMMVSGGCSHVGTPSIVPQAAKLEAKPLATGAVPEATSYSMKEPGESELLPRGHAYAPPMIPHNIDGMLIRKDDNPCMGCHEEGMMGAPQIPESHFTDLSTGVKGEALQMSRWSCTLCHAPQTDRKPLVENSFQG